MGINSVTHADDDIIICIQVVVKMVDSNRCSTCPRQVGSWVGINQLDHQNLMTKFIEAILLIFQNTINQQNSFDFHFQVSMF